MNFWDLMVFERIRRKLWYRRVEKYYVDLYLKGWYTLFKDAPCLN